MIIDGLSEAEKQLLIAVFVLEQWGQETDLASVEAQGKDYFGRYQAAWTDAYQRLLDQGFLEIEQGHYHLSPTGRPLAEAARAEQPRHLYFYNEFFSRVQTSLAHAEFCAQVYGLNLCQHGLMDMAQLAQLLDFLRLDEQSRVLEIGCGNGMAAEYIADRTGAHVTGVDSSTVGIAQAIERTRTKRNRLTFIAGDILGAALSGGPFDAVIAIDSIYFVADLGRLMDKLAVIVKAGGQMAVFYASWVGEGETRTSLAPARNRFGRLLVERGLSYRFWDLTAQDMAHWRRKLEVITSLRQAFEAEGNEFLYQNRFIEAKTHCQHVDAGRVSRYLYCVTVCK